MQGEPRLQLSAMDPVAAGGTRLIYRLQNNADCLVKVLRPHTGRVRRGVSQLLARLRPGGNGWFQLREIAAYRRAERQIIRGKGMPPVAMMLGPVATDLGWGLAVEAILDDSGLAPTVKQLAQEGRLDATALAALSHFAQEMLGWNLVIRDMKPDNIVYGLSLVDRQAGAPPRMILVDGLGDKNLLPSRTLFRTRNQRRLQRDFENLANWSGLHWDGRAFSLPAPPPPVTDQAK